LVRWLADQVRPDVINLTNALLSGMVHDLRRDLPGVPILCSLQGDDIFTESLPEPFRARTLALIRDHGQEMDGFIATSHSYADFMADYFQIPRNKIDVVHPGLNLAGYAPSPPDRQGQPFTIGYFARICPEKGFANLIDAFLTLRCLPWSEGIHLRVSGWLGDGQRSFFDQQVARLESAGLLKYFHHRECLDHAAKAEFFREIDVLSVPTTYHEPKGLYVLEALANGVPVVQPRHGSFPELVEATGGGLLVPPGDPEALARAWLALARDRSRAASLGQAGQTAVQARFTARRMAEDTATIYRRFLQAGNESCSR
ncbi:MAG: glycosyltransferase family 4 protein, partial [Gemmataceae bacterium]